MIAFCESGDDGWGGQLRVELAEGVDLQREPAAHRAVFSSCSLCGAEAIEDVARSITPFSSSEVDSTGICESGKRLRAEQPVFEATGGTHGAALVLPPPLVRSGGQCDEAIIIVREDIGRHNALDKVVGAAAMQGFQCDKPLIFLSGRLSFEMVAKAARAGIGAVAGVSAPTALSVQLARRLNMILAGFVREDTFTLYAGGGVGGEGREQDVRDG
jgi:FdhD protein